MEIKKSFTLQYIDWKNIENNVFHVTEEYNVMRSGSKEHYIPDLVLFVNGIPLTIIECKRPDMKAPISQAISQHLRNQQEDGIRQLYIYAQALLSLSTNHGRYASNGTKEKFWSHWEESFKYKEEEELYKTKLNTLKNTPLKEAVKKELFSDRFRYVRSHFDSLEKETIMPTEQDTYLFGLCSPERLLDFTYNFIVFDNGIKKNSKIPAVFRHKKNH